MKKYKLLLALTALFALGLTTVQVGCSHTDSTQQVEFKTLKSVGLTAKASLDAASQLLANGKITVTQYQTLATVYDTEFQPAYKLAVQAARSDLSTIASPDLVIIATKLATLIASYTN